MLGTAAASNHSRSMTILQFHDFSIFSRSKNVHYCILLHYIYFSSLIAAGYSLDDIGDATMNANQIKRQRMDSFRAYGWMASLGVGDQTKKLVRRSSKIIFDGVAAAAMGIARPALKKKSPSTPAC
jgi:hypothetical protein